MYIHSFIRMGPTIDFLGGGGAVFFLKNLISSERKS